MGVLASEEQCRACLEKIIDCAADTLEDLYSMGGMIGEGRFSKVYAGVSTSGANRGTPVALKEIDVCTLEEDDEALEMLEAEVLALRRAAGTEHVVRLHEVVAAADAVFLAMERVPGRELFELVEERGALDAPLVRGLIRQLLTALAALATLGVVHRDVKPENLMITEAEAGAAPRITLIDFGYAAILGSGAEPAAAPNGAAASPAAANGGEGGAAAGNGGAAHGLLSGVAGSPEYAAPEVLSWLEVEADESGTVEGEWYDAGCDVWSVGVTAHVLLSAELPFDLPEDGDEAAIVAAARNMTLNFSNKQWSGDGMELAQDFVRSCMMTDRHARPHAEKLLHHPWLAAAAPSRANGVNAAFIQMLDETTAIERAAKLPSAAPAP